MTDFFYFKDAPLTKRTAKRFSGLSVVTHFSDYRRKKKRVNSVNCASCDVTFSSLLKKRQYCRHCGDSFCSRCCSKRVKRAVFGATAPAAYEETVLVCNSCHCYLMDKEEENRADIWWMTMDCFGTCSGGRSRAVDMKLLRLVTRVREVTATCCFKRSVLTTWKVLQKPNTGKERRGP